MFGKTVCRPWILPSTWILPTPSLPHPALLDRILTLGYKLVTTNTISAHSPYGDGDPMTYRGVIDTGLQPTD